MLSAAQTEEMMVGWEGAETGKEKVLFVVLLSAWVSTLGGCTISISLYTMCERMELAGGRAVVM